MYDARGFLTFPYIRVRLYLKYTVIIYCNIFLYYPILKNISDLRTWTVWLAMTFSLFLQMSTQTMRDVRDGALTATCVELSQYIGIPVILRMGIA